MSFFWTIWLPTERFKIVLPLLIGYKSALDPSWAIVNRLAFKWAIKFTMALLLCNFQCSEAERFIMRLSQIERFGPSSYIKMIGAGSLTKKFNDKKWLDHTIKFIATLSSDLSREWFVILLLHNQYLSFKLSAHPSWLLGNYFISIMWLGLGWDLVNDLALRCVSRTSLAFETRFSRTEGLRML